MQTGASGSFGGGGGSLASRRAWLCGAALSCASGWAYAQAPTPGPAPEAEPDPLADEDRERRSIEAQAEKAGLGPFRVSRTANYLGIGDAVDVFRARTLGDCEAVRSDYMDYYRARGFDVAEPARRLTVVTLTDDRSFAAFLGKGVRDRPGKDARPDRPRRLPARDEPAHRLRPPLAGPRASSRWEGSRTSVRWPTRRPIN